MAGSLLALVTAMRVEVGSMIGGFASDRGSDIVSPIVHTFWGLGGVEAEDKGGMGGLLNIVSLEPPCLLLATLELALKKLRGR